MDFLEISQLLTDEYSAKILVATTRVPRSAQEISRKFGIPIAACYRRINKLEDTGLLRCSERRLSREGKRVSYYVSNLKHAYIFFEKGKLRVKFLLKQGSLEDYEKGWYEIDLGPVDEEEEEM